MRRNLITTLVLVFAIFSLVQTGMTIHYASQVSDFSLFTGNALQDSGDVHLCINTPPIISFDCTNTSLVEDIYYECLLNASDGNNDTLLFTAENISGSLFYSIDNSSGLFSAIPTNDDSFQDDVTILFTVTDDSGCSLNSDSVSVTFNLTPVNDAPVYLPNLGLISHLGPFSFSDGVSIRGIYLNNYFSDPDGDPLTFSSSVVSSEFSVVILPSSEIVLNANSCGSGYVFLRATDPSGLFAESSLISLKRDCDITEPSGGGGGGAAPREKCVSEWDCAQWGDCYANSTQKRKCTDVYACEPDYYIQYFWRDCDYIAQCFNGVRDLWVEGYELREEGIDCGGPCKPCETCFDGLKNNDEEETDCGGPNCDACMNCFDGIQNYGETGVDCGGLCDTCPSCFDDVQNQDESGVDCGGPCPACKRFETPDALGNFSRSLFFFIIPLAMLLLIGGVVYRIFHAQINAFIARFLWTLIRNKKKQVLLTVDQKNTLISMVYDVQKDFSFSSDSSDNYSYQSAIARVLGQFFDFLLSHSTHMDKPLARIDKLPASSLVKSLISDYYSQLELLDDSNPFSFSMLNLNLELLRQAIINFSPTTKQDIARPIHEVELFDSQDVIHATQILYNCAIALQFEEISIARGKYLDALAIYEKLSESDKEIIYPVLHLAFKNISYVSSYVSF